MERMRFQSVLDACEEDRFFISGSSTKRNHVNALWGLGMNDGNRRPAEKSKRDQALLSVVESVIFEGKGWSLKHARGVQEINAMNLQIDPTLLSSQVNRIGEVYIQSSGGSTPRAAL
jgi:hypothetical protein